MGGGGGPYTPWMVSTTVTNKSKIMFLWQRTVRFAESYSGSEDTSPWSFDDENDAKYLWIQFSSSIIDMRFVELVELIDETFASSYVFSKLFPLSSHVWSINSA